MRLVYFFEFFDFSVFCFFGIVVGGVFCVCVCV